MNTRAEECKMLTHWGNNNGIYVNPKLVYPVELQPGYYGVQTTEKLDPGELLILVPGALIFPTRHLQANAMLTSVFDRHPEVFSETARDSADCKYIVYMLWEQSKREESVWFSFFNSLPRDPGTLMDWADEELEELQDDLLIVDTITRRACDEVTLRSLFEVLSEESLFSEDFLTFEQIEYN